MRLVSGRIAAVILVILILFSGWTSQTSEAHAETPLTAQVVLDNMPTNEFVSYVSGIVEGLAYARFRKDTAAAGQNDEDGMKCIRDWYHGNSEIILQIEESFRKYGTYPPWVVLAVMIKRECGE